MRVYMFLLLTLIARGWMGTSQDVTPSEEKVSLELFLSGKMQRKSGTITMIRSRQLAGYHKPCSCEDNKDAVQAPYSHISEQIVLGVILVGIFVLVGFIVRFTLELKRANSRANFKVSWKYCQVFLCLPVGGLIILLGLVSWPLSETSLTCGSKTMLFALGFGLQFGALFSQLYKTWRHFVYLPRCELGHIVSRRPDRDERFSLVGIVLMEVLFGIFVLTIEELKPKRKCFSFENKCENDLLYATCSFSMIYGAFILFVHLAFGVLSLFMTVQVHNLFQSATNNMVLGFSQEKVDEFSTIVKSGAIWFVVGTVTYIVSATSFTTYSKDSRVSWYAIRTFGLVIAAICPVALIITHKIQILASYPPIETAAEQDDPPEGLQCSSSTVTKRSFQFPRGEENDHGNVDPEPSDAVPHNINIT